MSVARVYTSKFAGRLGKTLKCQRCGQPIEKGSTYYWYKVGFRSNYKHIRCTKSACYPRPSERESSKLAGVYAAQETATDSVSAVELTAPNWDDAIEELKGILSTAADDVRSVAEEYRDAADAMGDAGSEMEEKADTLESSADELEGWEPSEDEPQPCDEHDEFDLGCDECASNAGSWWEDTTAEASSAVEEMELP